MKLYSPFLFVLFFVITTIIVSCDTDKHPKLYNNVLNDSISKFVAIGNDNKVLPEDRLKSFEKAHYLAKKIGNDSILYSVIAYKILFTNEYFIEKSPETLNSLYEIVSKKKDERFAYYESRKADYLLYKQEYDSAYKYYNDSNLIYIKQKGNVQAGYNFVKIAWIYMLFNDYNSTEENATEALKVLKNIKDDYDYTSNIYLSLGNAYTGLKQYDNAIKKYLEATRFTKDGATKQIIQNNIAAVNILKGDYNNAIKILLAIQKTHLLTNDLENTAAVLENLGYAKFKNGDKSGIVEIQQAMKINQSQNYNSQLTKSYLHLSECYNLTNKQLAINYANQAYKLATNSKSPEDRINALYKLFRLTSGETSKNYSDDLYDLKDSISDVRSNQNNKFALIKYSLSEKNKQLQKAVKENTIKDLEKKQTTLYYIIGIIILMLLGVILFVLYRAKYRREKLKEIYNTETRISKKLHDELANDVYSAMTFAGKKELSEENKENLVTKLYDIYSRTRNISTENASIDTGVNFDANFREMIGAYNNDQVKVIVKELEKIDWSVIENNKKVAVYRVVHELLVNMKKHSQCSFAMLTFKIIKNNLQIDYNDNGVGAPSDTIILKKGLLNVENRIRAIKGTVTFDNTSDKGFRLSIVFPI